MESGTDSGHPVQAGHLDTGPRSKGHFAIKRFEREQDTEDVNPGTEYKVEGVYEDSELNFASIK